MKIEIGDREKYVLLKASFSGAKQVAAYYERATALWENYRSELAKELFEQLNLTDSQLSSRSRAYSAEVSVPELECTEGEISRLRKHVRQKGYSLEKLAEVIPARADDLQFAQLILMPGLAYADGLADVTEENTKHWLIGVGINYPLSSDAADDFVDNDFPSHPIVDKEPLGTFYKLAASALLQNGKWHYSKVTTGDTRLDELLKRSLADSLHKVSLNNKRDMEAQKRKDVPVQELHEIYDGKIGEVEAAVFHSIPSMKRAVVSTFVEGARNLAIATQIKDDFDDINGDPVQHLPPRIPNPSFFLTYFRNQWEDGKDLRSLFRSASDESYKTALDYLRLLEINYQKLPNDFTTKPFFKSIDALFKHFLDQAYEQAIEGRNLDQLIPQLELLL